MTLTAFLRDHAGAERAGHSRGASRPISAAAPAISTSCTRCRSPRARALPPTNAIPRPDVRWLRRRSVRRSPQRRRAAAHRPRAVRGRRAAARACCTWRSCAAIVRARPSEERRRHRGAGAAGRRCGVHRGRSWRLLAHRDRCSSIRRRFPATSFTPARSSRSRRTKSATSASRSRWSSPRAATLPKTRCADVVVDIDPIDAVVDLEAALAPGAPLVHRASRRRTPRRTSCSGRATTRSARERADVVIKRRFLYDRGVSARRSRIARSPSSGTPAPRS